MGATGRRSAAQGDLGDPDALAAALDGVEGAFLLIPPILAPSPGYTEARTVISGYVEALRRTPPPRLVCLSSVGSQQSSGLGNIATTHLMEEALGDLPFPTAFVRAGGFIDNYIFGLNRAAETGWFDSFFTPTDRGVPMVASIDIGEEIARLLIDGWSGKRAVELGSYRSSDELAHAMGEVLGRHVQARSIPREQWPVVLEAMGLPPGRTVLYEEMMDGFNSGWIDFGVPGTKPVAGKTTPAEVFANATKGREPLHASEKP